MIQGWHNDDYIILFEDQYEAISMTARYGTKDFLPGFTVVGLKGWDDFILRDEAQQFYIAPTVPLLAQHLRPFTFDIDILALHPDSRVAGKVKWYTQPLVFGGDAQSEQNITWITIDQHTEAVKWWNIKYRQLQ